MCRRQNFLRKLCGQIEFANDRQGVDFWLSARTEHFNNHRFAIMTLEDGTHIGNCMYYDLDLRRREAELGIMVGDRAYWNGGYGTEAAGLLLDHLFEELKLERVYLKTLEWNIRAQNAFTKCGFRQYGWGNQGRYRFMLMEIKRPEWEARRHDQSQTQ